MLFNSYTFLVFFTIFLIAYHLIRIRSHVLSKIWILLGSCVFYAWSYPPYLILLFWSITIDFTIAKKIHSSKSNILRKRLMQLSILLNLGILGFFKYSNFFISNLNSFLSHNLEFLDIVLPVGISFYTFQSMSYTVDVYRRKICPERSMLNFCVYVSFFPQLVAGPIVLARDFLGQLKVKQHISMEKILSGLFLIFTGLFLKCVVADRVAISVDYFYSDISRYSGFEVWYYCILYSIQIFGDFAGYSNIAIGLGLLMGFHLPENFRSPYLAVSITDFWRRWHISLSTWLREYLYISLGGNRKGEYLTYVNLLITMLLGGLWHGASWNFVIWGGLHGVYLIIERRSRVTGGLVKFFSPRFSFIGKCLSVFLTFNIVTFTWIFFRSPSLATSQLVISQLFESYSLDSVVLVSKNAVFLFLLYGLMVKLLVFLQSKSRDRFYPVFLSASFLLLVHTIVTLGTRSNSFIYFQF